MDKASNCEPLISRLKGIREIMMAHHAAGSLLPSAAKGAEREVLIREFLAKVFPPPFRFGSGAVIDSTGSMSGQLDVVVEFPFFPSFPTPGAAERLYLAESIAFVIEVKSNLSSQWDEVERSVEKLRPLRRSWRASLQHSPDGGLSLEDASTSRIPFVAVGYRGYATVESLDQRLQSTVEEKRPDATLVLESGAYICTLTEARRFGHEGLFALCTDAAYFATNVLVAHPDFRGYFGGHDEKAG
jgi:hypothetical protein